MKFLREIPKEKMQKLVLVVIVTVIGVSAMMVFWIGEEQTSLANSKAKIAKLEPQIEDAERKERAELQNEPLRRQIVAFVETQRQSMVTGDLFSWAVREVSLFAERYSVQMASVRPGMRMPHPINGSYEVYTVQVEVRGEYDALGKFLCDLENNFPTAQVRSLDLAVADATIPVRNAMLELAFLIWPKEATAWISPKPEAEPRKKP